MLKCLNALASLEFTFVSECLCCSFDIEAIKQMAIHWTTDIVSRIKNHINYQDQGSELGIKIKDRDQGPGPSILNQHQDVDSLVTELGDRQEHLENGAQGERTGIG